MTDWNKDRTHKSWTAMKQRCQNPEAPDYVRYGGHGIRVCDRWQSFPAFLADMGARPVGTTLDRVKNEQGYFPCNCRWATPAQQQQNMRSTKLNARRVKQMRWLYAGGFKQADLARAFGVSQSLVSLVTSRQMWK